MIETKNGYSNFDNSNRLMTGEELVKSALQRYESGKEGVIGVRVIRFKPVRSRFADFLVRVIVLGTNEPRAIRLKIVPHPRGRRRIEKLCKKERQPIPQFLVIGDADRRDFDDSVVSRCIERAADATVVTRVRVCRKHLEDVSLSLAAMPEEERATSRDIRAGVRSYRQHFRDFHEHWCPQVQVARMQH